MVYFQLWTFATLSWNFNLYYWICFIALSFGVITFPKPINLSCFLCVSALHFWAVHSPFHSLYYMTKNEAYPGKPHNLSSCQSLCSEARTKLNLGFVCWKYPLNIYWVTTRCQVFSLQGQEAAFAHHRVWNPLLVRWSIYCCCILSLCQPFSTLIFHNDFAARSLYNFIFFRLNLNLVVTIFKYIWLFTLVMERYLTCFVIFILNLIMLNILRKICHVCIFF